MTPATPSVGFTVHRCVDCRFHRMRAEPELFSSAELQTPGAGGLSGRRMGAPAAGSDAKRRGQHADAFEHVADAVPVDDGRGEEHDVLRTEEDRNG